MEYTRLGNTGLPVSRALGCMSYGDPATAAAQAPEMRALELMAMCADMGVGVVPYSPQGKGRLARPWGEQSHRSAVDHVVQSFDYTPSTSPS